MNKKTYRILSIDAWREDNGWTWNNWFHVGDFDLPQFLDSNRKILQFMRESGYLTEYSKGRCAVDDDGYNVVILDRATREPLFAIEYGNTL